MLTISRLDGDTPVSYNGVMPIGRDQLGELLLGCGHLRGDKVPTSLALAIEHLWTTWPSREPPVLGLLRGSLPAWVYFSAQPDMTTSPSVGGQA